jgi:hypothetical protein
MAFLNECHEIDDQGRGRDRSTIHLAPVAFRDGGYLRRIVDDWQQGAGPFPHVVTDGAMKLYFADGAMRICPTREDDHYVAFGRPYYHPSSWQPVPMNQFTRNGHILQSTNPNFNAYVYHGRHFVKWALWFKGGYRPPNGELAFPVDMVGLTRSGGNFYRNGVRVMHIRQPVLIDWDNPSDVRPIALDLRQLNGQWYLYMVLPAFTGMSKPVLDPQLVLQPGAAAGYDTWVKEDAPDTENSTSNQLIFRAAAGQRRFPLIKFDFSTLPAGVAVTAHTLYLYVASAVNTVNTMSFYRILAVNAGWLEACTWNHADGAGATQHWAGDVGSDGRADAGCSVSGTDYNATAIGAITCGAIEPAGTEWVIPLALNQWAALYAANNGLVGLKDAAGALQYLGSSDHATVLWRPKYVIDWVEGGDPVFGMPTFRMPRGVMVPFVRTNRT